MQQTQRSPTQSTPTQNTPTQGSSASSNTGGACECSEADAQDTLGNAAINEMLSSSMSTPEADASSADGGVCDPCAEAAEEQRIFESRSFGLVNNIPSTGLGKFDATWDPTTAALDVTVKIHFEFESADDTPGFWDLIGSIAAGDDISHFFWSDSEKADFVSEFISGVQSTWSGQHEMASTKPCWEQYRALPTFHVEETDSRAAHYSVTVHKVSDLEQPFVYRAGVHNENLSDPAAQPTADFWETDTDTNADFRSGRVATDERERIDAAITAAGAGRIQFGKDSAELPPAERGKLDRLAASLREVYPSAPRIPLDLSGWASSEGAATRNDQLSLDRALAVEGYLSGKGIPQPMTSMGFGATGAANDPANRRVDVETDTAFESSYNSNAYAVGPHEFSHMLGLTDEYRATESGLLAGARTRYEALMTSAGVEQPRWGEDTSSIVSAGVDVLPRHYVTVWEALGRMTTPEIPQNQWTIA